MVTKYGPEEPLFLILIIFLVLGWLACVLRAWVKLFIIKKVTADDYLMFGAILVYSGYATAGLYGVVEGVAGLTSGITPEQASIGLRSWWICEVLYPPLTLLARTSVAVFLLRIAVLPAHRLIIRVSIISFWIITIPLFMVVIFQCRPITYFWLQPLPSVPRGTCMDPHVVFAVSVAHSAMTACCDWILGTLPVLMLWRVQLSVRTKVTLCILLGMGIFAGIALIVRITYVHPYPISVGFLYESIDVANWSILEPSVCIIAGCLGTLRPLFTRYGLCGMKRKASRRATKTTGRQHRGTHGISATLVPKYFNKDTRYTRSTGKIGGLHSTSATTRVGNDLDTVIGLDKEKLVNLDSTLNCQSSKDGSSSGSNGSGSGSGSGRKSPGEPVTHQSHGSRQSADSSFSSRLASFSSLPVDLHFPQSGQIHDEQQQEQVQLQPIQHSCNPTLSVSRSAPLPTEAAPCPPPTPPAFPAPCHIVVSTTTEVDYDKAPSTAASMPFISGRGATMGSGLEELPKSSTFQGHTVQICGPPNTPKSKPNKP